MKTSCPTTTPPRHGATLTEVLMSLLIMSIGIVSVFSLFPISILSSIKATQLTNGKILAENAVEHIRFNPILIAPPTFSNERVVGEWEPQTTYSTNDVVIPVIESGNLFPVPYIAYRCTAGGMSNWTEPTWPRTGGNTVTDGGVTWEAMNFTGDNRHFVVDPLGRHLNSTDDAIFYGYDTNVSLRSDIRRADGGYSTFGAAASDFTLGDSWTVELSAIPTGVTGDTVSFPAEIDISGFVATGTRVTLISTDGTRSASRDVESVSGQTITINNTPPAADFPGYLDSPGEVSVARVEVFNRRYSYFITVRRPSITERPQVHLVVVFNRGFNGEDEVVYDANFASNNGGGTGFSGGPNAVNGLLNADTVRIAYDPSGIVPLIREGNYLLDSRNMIWYRIINAGTPTLVSGLNQVDITVDRSVEVRTPSTGNSGDVGRVVFMPGIIEIYEL